jgi:hypothetical protein
MANPNDPYGLYDSFINAGRGPSTQLPVFGQDGAQSVGAVAPSALPGIAGPGATGAASAAPAAAAPFQWGAGGQMLTPEEIAMKRKMAMALMQGDYSPIASPWQGLARVANNLVGALDERDANRASQAAQANAAQAVQSFTGGGSGSGAAAAAAATNPYLPADVKALALKEWERQNPSAEKIFHHTDNFGNVYSMIPGQAPKLDFIDQGGKTFMQPNGVVITVHNPLSPSGPAGEGQITSTSPDGTPAAAPQPVVAPRQDDWTVTGGN